jgi:tyrosine-protein kinase Etk/Wzc
VLLIDADFRRADMAEQFAEPTYLARQPVEDGLVEVLSGECDLAHAIRRDRLSPLEYLPIAAPATNPASLLATQSMRRLVEALRQHYSLVIINTPSVLDFSDACGLAQVADTFLLVLSWDETQQPAVVESVKRLRDAGASVSGTVINRCGRRHVSVPGAQARRA